MDKNYLKKVLIVALIVVAAIVLFVDIAHFVIKRNETDYLTQFPDRVTINLSDQPDVMIVRNEFAVEEDLDGKTILYLVDNGERVEKGALLAYIYPFTDREDVINEIERLEKRGNLCADVVHESGMYTLPKLTKLIDQTLSELDSLKLENSFGQIEALQYRLDVLLSIRDIRMGSVSVQKYEQELTSVLNQKDEMIRSLGTPLKSVTASEAGYFYDTCDGCENLFTFSDVTSLDVSEFDEAVLGVQDKQGKICKIVRTYSWYAVCKVSADEAQHYTLGKDYLVNFANEPIDGVTMRLSHMACEYGAESALLVFSSDLQPSGFSYERVQHTEIIYESHEGYAIPATAVRCKDSVQGVYVLIGYRVLFRQINPVYEKDGLILADQNVPEGGKYQALNFYDNMIVKGSDLHVDKIIE